MSVNSKKDRQDKIGRVLADQVKVYSEIHEIIMQAFRVGMVRDSIRDFRYLRASKMKEYNEVMSQSHVALENHAISQIWKLFDKTNSVFNVWYVVKNMPHKELFTWLDVEIEKIQKDINCLSAWRHNLVGHRGEMGHFNPVEFEEKFKDIREAEGKLKSFLLFFLCQIKLEMQHIPIEKTMCELARELNGYATFLNNEKGKVLKYDW